jgi:hypothetical protein
MATKKPPDPIQGPGFIMLPARSRSRRGILRAGQQLTGDAFTKPSFVFRFHHESQLPTYLAERIETTISKLLFTLGQCYAEGESSPQLLVQGARAQYGRGNSGFVYIGGVRYLTGVEAAHYGIGTITRPGGAVSLEGLRQIRDLARQRGIAPEDIESSFPANGRLVSYGLVQDGSTFIAPAYYNQTEGVQEKTRQIYMRGLLPLYVPQTPDALENQMNALGERFLNTLADNHRTVIQPIDDRLADLQHNPKIPEFLQARSDVHNLVFDGKEHVALDAMKNEFQNGASEFHVELQKVARDIPLKAADIAEWAEAAREERK